MSRKLWVVFVISQIIGVSLALYSSRFEVGAGGAREFLWIPAALLLLPGILFGYIANVLSFRIFNLGSSAAFYVVVVLLNAASWYAVVSIVRNRQRVAHL